MLYIYILLFFFFFLRTLVRPSRRRRLCIYHDDYLHPARARERLPTNSARVDVVDASVPARVAYPVPSWCCRRRRHRSWVRARARRGPIAAVGAKHRTVLSCVVVLFRSNRPPAVTPPAYPRRWPALAGAAASFVSALVRRRPATMRAQSADDAAARAFLAFRTLARPRRWPLKRARRIDFSRCSVPTSAVPADVGVGVGGEAHILGFAVL